jgi:DNA replicative helicase MCM subunit Mcm2 (Cdc46/Mcm family)
MYVHPDPFLDIAYADLQIIPQDVLRKYIMYSKEHIRPKLHQLDQDKLARLYADLRRESLATGSFPITVRHLESMIRMSEASAKMHLREYVRSDDIDLAIQVTVGSFVNAQKMSIKKTLERVSSLMHNKIGGSTDRYRALGNTFTKQPIMRSLFPSSLVRSSRRKSSCIVINVVKTRNLYGLQLNNWKRGRRIWRSMMLRRS